MKVAYHLCRAGFWLILSGQATIAFIQEEDTDEISSLQRI